MSELPPQSIGFVQGFKCHSEHMKAYKNKATVTLTFRNEELLKLRFLADKYSEGCAMTFLQEFIVGKIDEEFKEDFEIDRVKETLQTFNSDPV
jgi:hypothetical protein